MDLGSTPVIGHSPAISIDNEDHNHPCNEEFDANARCWRCAILDYEVGIILSPLFYQQF